ncbi:MAG: hypothetical protein V4722_14825 [Bacteroidota bacterium]
MKKLFLLSVAATLISSISFATIRRIQYWGVPVAGVDYPTGTAAVTAAAIGDTIMVFHTVAETFTIDKRLVIIGPGYWNWAGVDANFNPNLQNIQPASNSGIGVVFAPGSDGTLITGCKLYFQTSGVVAIHNIKIRNCESNGLWYIGNTGANLTYDNWEFSKNVLHHAIYSASVATNKLTNLKVFNCIADGSAGYPCVSLSTALGQTGIIENCSFYSTGASLALTFNGFLVQNCIFHSSAPTNSTNSVFNNNVFTSAPAVTGSGNILNAVANNIFVGFPTLGSNSYDGKYQLKVGSPAIGAGIGGIDCGAYGGVNPYKLSLIPAVPAFYKLTAPGTAATSNPYPITFSVRANN